MQKKRFVLGCPRFPNSKAFTKECYYVIWSASSIGNQADIKLVQYTQLSVAFDLRTVPPFVSAVHSAHRNMVI